MRTLLVRYVTFLLFFLLFITRLSSISPFKDIIPTIPSGKDFTGTQQKFYLPLLLKQGTGSSTPTPTNTPTPTPTNTPTPTGGPIYQLKASANGRYLIDGNGDSFLMVAGSAQAMIFNASLAQAETFLADRQSKGINALWLELIGNDAIGGRSDSSTYDSIIPFSTPGNLSTPNEAYFARVDAMINLAADFGIVVILDPLSFMMYAPTMRSNGTTACYNYGAYLGSRYKNFPNIIWLNGEDVQTWTTQSDDDLIIALANGILSEDTNHIHTVQLNYNDSASREDSDWDSIISLNAAYNYYTDYARILTEYNRIPAMPVYLSESTYEHEHPGGLDEGSPNVLRRQEYRTMLSGACGQLNGNHYFSYFTSDFASHLNDPGQVQLTYLRDLFVSREWYNLIPDQTHVVLTAGYGTYSNTDLPSQNNYATSAYLADGSLAIIYMPDNRTMTADMSFFSGMVTARWFDPTDGTYTADAASPLSNSGTHNFSRPESNTDGDHDWVLVLEAN